MEITESIKRSHLFDVTSWRSICDITLTLKQARKADDKGWFKITQYQCEQAFKHFMNVLNRCTYGNAVRRHGKKLRVLAVIEKGIDRRWHIHAAIEPPKHMPSSDFEKLVQICWEKTDWGYQQIAVRSNADRGWIEYMLKPSQKTGFEAWSDCIDWFSFNNPIADV
jgi:hypothetical protein